MSSKRAVLLVGLCSSLAFAQANAGVSDERVTLPQTSGSIAGVGENASTSGNHGALSYSVNVEVPAGFPGLTPQISFSYSSSGGAGVLGMGWAMPGYSIDRMTSKGLQKYDLNDRFVVDGSEELVKVADSGSSATYRARFEGGFVRYTWLSRGTGDGGSWKAEFPDGRVGYYGADKAGLAVPTAQVRVPASTNTFSWQLVLMEDPWGHQEKFTWTKDASGSPLLERIEYLFEGALPRHSVRFTYEPRTDVLSDAKPGFDLRLTQRLKDVRVFSGTTAPEQIRRYALEYETMALSGGGTRLAAVSRFGRGDVAYPVKFSFGYSKTLGGTCATNCDKPFVASMGSLGVNFSTGRASLVDINGDAIPDVLFSDAQNRHQFFYGKLDTEGHASFATTARQSAKTTTSFVLGDARTQLLDVNGDGFVDITQAKLPAVLCNDGSGDWVDSSFCTGTPPGLPGSYTPEEDPVDTVQQDPRYVRFFDYDNDKRIDWLRTLAGSTSTEVLANTDGGFVAVTVDNIGAAFDESPLQLADMNGDGLQDPVQLVVSGAVVTVQYKLNLGFGKWSPTWTSIALSGLTASQASVAELQDINGDSLADVVAVTGNEVALVLNRNGDSFAPVLTVTSADLGMGAIPQRLSDTTVSFADMNGNGSDDIVWFQASGAIAYLELFPVRPNLISRIDNGVGAVQLVSYGTSIAEQARDAAAGKPWPHRVPNATVLVTRVDSFVTLTGSDSGGLRESTVYRYHSGYYDGVEKQFRGYEGVDQEQLGDLATDAQEPGVVVLEFDVGATEPAFAGRQRRRATYSTAATTPVLISEERSLHELCSVAEVPATANPPVVFACERATTRVVAERDVANARTVQSQREYDGYGNVTRSVSLGVTNLGTPESPRACEACVASGLLGRPCGAMCMGDERFVETEFIAPGTGTGGLWMLRKSKRSTSGAVTGNLQAETLTFYDGPDFVGLPAGQLTKGGVTRVARRSGNGPNDFIDVTRVGLDPSGNPLVGLMPNGSLTGLSQRRHYTYDAAGLHATRVEIALDATASLRRDLQYEPLFEEMSQASDWHAVVSGQPVATPQLTRYRYDEHGRISRVLDPGDSDTSPSTEYQYELSDPASRVLMLQRSTATGAADLVTASCFDGRGRQFQTRRQISASSWQVSGFTEFDSRGAEKRVFQPYLATTGACEVSAPEGVAFERTTLDVLGRVLTEVEPDGAQRRFEYGPLVRRLFDEDANDSTSVSFGLPTIEESDGQGRLVSIERTAPGGAPSALSRLEYDANGNLLTVKDPAGNAHVQLFDPLGRMTQVTDPNSGVSLFEYDAAGNPTRRTDARGQVVRTDFDALNRQIAQWDESAEAATKVTWRYDTLADCAECTNAGGRPTQIEWTNAGTAARERLGYDPKGNLVFDEKRVDGHPLVTRYRYDAADRLTASLYPGELTVVRTWDAASRAFSLPGFVDRLDYDDRGQVSAVSFSNGVHSEYGYDQRQRLSSLHTVTRDGQVALDLRYVRRGTGDLKDVTDLGTRPERARHGAHFTPDAWGRITRAELDGASGEAEVLSFSYDELDDVKSLTSSLGAASPAHVGEYTRDPNHPNALTSAGPVTYGVDAAGAVSQRDATAFEYDHLGRLVRATRDGVETGAFGFGPGPARFVEQEGDFTTWHLSDELEIRDGIAVVYAKLGDRRIARSQTDALAATLLSDLNGNATIDISDAVLAQAAAPGVAHSPVKALLASSARRLLMQDVVWLHEDQLHSLVAATDAQGALVAEQSFYPFGEERSSTGFVDAYGFTGQQREASTGLIHFRYRELDPRSGRWTSVDPAFAQLSSSSARLLGQSTSAYAYVGNNFANNVDPTGLFFGRAPSAVKASKPGLLRRTLNKLTGKSQRNNAKLYATRLNASPPVAQGTGPYVMAPSFASASEGTGAYSNFEPVYSNFEPVYSNFQTPVYGNFETPVYGNFEAPVYADFSRGAYASAPASQYVPNQPAGASGIYGRPTAAQYAFSPPVAGVYVSVPPSLYAPTPPLGATGIYGRAVLPGL